MDIEKKNFRKLNTESDELFIMNDLDDNTLVLVDNESEINGEVHEKLNEFEIINNIPPSANEIKEQSVLSDQRLELVDNSSDLEVDWKKEAMMGNFMPATVKLHRREISVDDIIDPVTGSRLIHLAVGYSFLNVTRCFIEIFGCDINSFNSYGQTALHLVCNNQSKDAFLFSYLIKNDNIEIEHADRSGFTPLFYAVMNNFNIALMTLANLKCDLSHVDNFGNNVIYHSIIAGNKFAFNFLMRHMPQSNVNQSYYQGEASLADVLITSRISCITKHLVKYYHNSIDLKSVQSCQKTIDRFPHYNKFNYDLLNTLYYYKTRSFIRMLIALFRKDRTMEGDYSTTSSHSYTFKFYNFRAYIHDLVLNDANSYIKYAGIFCYILTMLHAAFSLNTFVSASTGKDSVFNVVNLSMYSAFAVVFYLIFNFFLNKYDDKFYDEQAYNLTNPLYTTDHVAHQIYEAIDRNPLDLFFEEEICETCLTKKAKSTNHCNLCKKCVHNFYFHSKLLNVCFSRRNVYLYVLLILALLFIHFGLIYYLWIGLDNEILTNFPHSEYILENSKKTKTIYSSDYFTTNFITFLFNVSFMKLFCVFVLFVTGVLYLQTIISLVLCIGYDVTYYNMFRYHKKSLGEIRSRNNLFYNIPHPNLVSVSQFIKNLFKKK